MRISLAVLAGGLLLAASLAAPATAQTSIQCDGFGACYGTVDGQPLSGFKDGFGNISGRVGDLNFSAYVDAFGNVSGRLGERNFQGYVDAFGNGSLRYLDGRGPDASSPRGAPSLPQAGSRAAAPRPSVTLPERPVWEARPAPPQRGPTCFTTRQGRKVCSKVQ